MIAPDERAWESREEAGDDRHRGEGAVLGVRVLRYSGIQGTAMLGASVLHMVTIFVVAGHPEQDREGGRSAGG